MVSQDDRFDVLLHAAHEFRRVLHNRDELPRFHENILWRHFRILEWEFFIRSLGRTGFDYYLATRRRDIDGLLAWHKRREEIKRVRELVLPGAPPVDEDTSSGFRHPATTKFVVSYPDAHSSMFHLFEPRASSSLRARRDSNTSVGPARSLLLVEDGELTFFSVLWILRRARRFPGQFNAWIDGFAELSVDFDFGGSGPEWKPATFVRAMERCGIIVADPRTGNVGLSPRWWSLLKWIDEHAQAVARAKGIGEANQIRADVLPLKHPGFASMVSTPMRRFADALFAFFRARSPVDTAFELPAKSTPVVLRVAEFADMFRRTLLAKMVDSRPGSGLLNAGLPDAGEPPPGRPDARTWDGHDHTLFAQVRTPFFPIEFLLRASQPYALNVLIAPISYDGEQKPHAIAVATIADSPPPAPLPLGLGSEHDGSTLARNRWFTPYWSLLQSMAVEWFVDDLKRDAREAGTLAGILNHATAVSHEIGPMALLLSVGPPKKRFVWKLQEYEAIVEELIGRVPVEEAAQLREALKAKAVVSPLSEIHEAVTGYLLLVTESKYATRESSLFDWWNCADLTSLFEEAEKWVRRIVAGTSFSKRDPRKLIDLLTAPDGLAGLTRGFLIHRYAEPGIDLGDWKLRAPESAAQIEPAHLVPRTLLAALVGSAQHALLHDGRGLLLVGLSNDMRHGGWKLKITNTVVGREKLDSESLQERWRKTGTGNVLESLVSRIAEAGEGHVRVSQDIALGVAADFQPDIRSKIEAFGEAQLVTTTINLDPKLVVPATRSRR